MTTSVVHVFYEVYMGWSHASLLSVLQQNTGKRQLDRGELALFVNKSWTGVKILAPGNNLLYHRSEKPIAIEAIRYLPTALGGQKLAFSKNLEAHLIKAFEAKFGKQTKRLKVAYA